jgi:hypothetical protein
MKRVTHHLFWSCILVLMLLKAAIPVHADEPVIQRFHIDVDDMVLCPGFNVAVTGAIDYTDTYFYDQAGNLARVQETFQVYVTFVNLATQKTVVEHDAGLFVFDPAANTLKRTGLPLSVREEGGFLWLDAGNIVFNIVTGEVIFEAGPHEGFYGDPFVCEDIA